MSGGKGLKKKLYHKTPSFFRDLFNKGMQQRTSFMFTKPHVNTKMVWKILKIDTNSHPCFLFCLTISYSPHPPCVQMQPYNDGRSPLLPKYHLRKKGRHTLFSNLSMSSERRSTSKDKPCLIACWLAVQISMFCEKLKLEHCCMSAHDFSCLSYNTTITMIRCKTFNPLTPMSDQEEFLFTISIQY